MSKPSWDWMPNNSGISHWRMDTWQQTDSDQVKRLKGEKHSAKRFKSPWSSDWKKNELAGISKSGDPSLVDIDPSCLMLWFSMFAITRMQEHVSSSKEPLLHGVMFSATLFDPSWVIQLLYACCCRLIPQSLEFSWNQVSSMLRKASQYANKSFWFLFGSVDFCRPCCIVIHLWLLATIDNALWLELISTVLTDCPGLNLAVHCPSWNTDRGVCCERKLEGWMTAFLVVPLPK